MINFEKFIRTHELITTKTNEALGGIQNEIEEIKYEQMECEKERKKLMERVEQDEASSVITQNHTQKRMNLIEERLGRLRRSSIHPPNTAYKMPKKREDPEKSHGLVEMYNSFSQSGGNIQEKEDALMDENAKLMIFDALKNETRETLGGDLSDPAPIPEVRKRVRIGPGPDTLVFDPPNHFRNDFQGNS
jgi:septal ring factor EnvC (AmiA/AmiB activator)